MNLSEVGIWHEGGHDRRIAMTCKTLFGSLACPLLAFGAPAQPALTPPPQPRSPITSPDRPRLLFPVTQFRHTLQGKDLNSRRATARSYLLPEETPEVLNGGPGRVRTVSPGPYLDPGFDWGWQIWQRNRSRALRVDRRLGGEGLDLHIQLPPRPACFRHTGKVGSIHAEVIRLRHRHVRGLAGAWDLRNPKVTLPWKAARLVNLRLARIGRATTTYGHAQDCYP